VQLLNVMMSSYYRIKSLHAKGSVWALVVIEIHAMICDFIYFTSALGIRSKVELNTFSKGLIRKINVVLVISWNSVVEVGFHQ
jgi:hypothetical protein